MHSPSWRSLLCLAALLMVDCAAATPSAPTTSPPGSPPGEAKDLSEAAPEVLIRRPPSSSGGLSGDALGWALFQHSGALGRCYAEAGGARAGRGVVYLLLDVEGQGRIERVTVGHSDISGARFEGCLQAALREIPLPSSTGRSLLQAHLVFGASDEDEGRALLGRYRASRASTDATDSPEAAIPLSDLRRRIQSCYERSLRSRPGLRGRMMLELTVEVDGHVSEASLTERSLDERLSRCVLSVARNLRLEGEYASAATLQYPLILEPGR